jgi:hypothetical protein
VSALRWSVAPVDPTDSELTLLLPAIGCAAQRGGWPVDLEVTESDSDVSILALPRAGEDCVTRELKELERVPVPLAVPLGERTIRDAPSGEPAFVNGIDGPETGLRYSCDGGLTFPVRDLLGPGLDPAVVGWSPSPGRHIVAATDTAILEMGPVQPNGRAEFRSVGRTDLGGWTDDAWGSCRVEAVHQRLDQASWRTRSRQIDPQARSIPVWVIEQSCASGQPATGRVRVVELRRQRDAWLVVMATKPIGGDCQSNPRTPYLLTLPRPLGDRVLLDGGVYPPQPRPKATRGNR